MSYEDIKLNVQSNVQIRMYRERTTIDGAISSLMDFYLTNEIYDYLVVLLDVQSEINKLRQNLITIYFNELNRFF
jgi:hypothetical protein